MDGGPLNRQGDVEDWGGGGACGAVWAGAAGVGRCGRGQGADAGSWAFGAFKQFSNGGGEYATWRIGVGGGGRCGRGRRAWGGEGGRSGGVWGAEMGAFKTVF